jgi:short-subunit dehydrogenase
VKSLKIKPSILVNNAAQGQYGEFSETDINRELEIINLNIASVVILTKLFLKDMLQRGDGGILNVSSVASPFRDLCNQFIMQAKLLSNRLLQPSVMK